MSALESRLGQEYGELKKKYTLSATFMVNSPIFQNFRIFRHMYRKQLNIMLVFLLLSPLSAAVIATYVTYPLLHFLRFNDVYQQRYGGVVGNTFAD
jgi:hypothetical protein